MGVQCMIEQGPVQLATDTAMPLETMPCAALTRENVSLATMLSEMPSTARPLQLLSIPSKRADIYSQVTTGALQMFTLGGGQQAEMQPLTSRW